MSFKSGILMTASFRNVNFSLCALGTPSPQSMTALMCDGLIFVSWFLRATCAACFVMSSMNSSRALAIASGVVLYILPISWFYCIIFLMRLRGNFESAWFFFFANIFLLIIINNCGNGRGSSYKQGVPTKLTYDHNRAKYGQSGA